MISSELMISSEAGPRLDHTIRSERVLAVDRIACDGYGSCAELVPELITLDEWGYPIVRPGPVPSGLLGPARMAVDTCPVLALRLATAGRATITSGGETHGRGG